MAIVFTQPSQRVESVLANGIFQAVLAPTTGQGITSPQAARLSDVWIEKIVSLDGSEVIRGKNHASARPAWLSGLLVALPNAGDGSKRYDYRLTVNESTWGLTNVKVLWVGMEIRNPVPHVFAVPYVSSLLSWVGGFATEIPGYTSFPIVGAGVPAGWSSGDAGQPATWSVVSGVAGALNGTALKATTTGVNGARFALWDAIGEASDYDIYARVKRTTVPMAESAYAAAEIWGGVHGATAAIEGPNKYAICVGATSEASTTQDSLTRIYRISGGMYNAGQATVPTTWDASPNDWYWIRLQATAFTLHAKVWQGLFQNEPASFNNYGGGVRSITPGKVGVGAFFKDRDFYWDQFSVGINGNAPPPLINPTIETINATDVTASNYGPVYTTFQAMLPGLTLTAIRTKHTVANSTGTVTVRDTSNNLLASGAFSHVDANVFCPDIVLDVPVPLTVGTSLRLQVTYTGANRPFYRDADGLPSISTPTGAIKATELFFTQYGATNFDRIPLVFLLKNTSS